MRKILYSLAAVGMIIMLYGASMPTKTRYVLTDNHPKSSVVSDTLFGDTTVFNASFYGKEFYGRKTASGLIYQGHEHAAHKSLPFGTRILLTNGDSSYMIKIVDRGPWISGRDLDISQEAALQLGFYNKGHTKLKGQIVK